MPCPVIGDTVICRTGALSDLTDVDLKVPSHLQRKRAVDGQSLILICLVGFVAVECQIQSSPSIAHTEEAPG